MANTVLQGMIWGSATSVALLTVASLVAPPPVPRDRLAALPPGEAAPVAVPLDAAPLDATLLDQGVAQGTAPVAPSRGDAVSAGEQPVVRAEGLPAERPASGPAAEPAVTVADAGVDIPATEAGPEAREADTLAPVAEGDATATAIGDAPAGRPVLIAEAPIRTVAEAPAEEPAEALSEALAAALAEAPAPVPQQAGHAAIVTEEVGALDVVAVEAGAVEAASMEASTVDVASTVSRPAGGAPAGRPAAESAPSDPLERAVERILAGAPPEGMDARTAAPLALPIAEEAERILSSGAPLAAPPALSRAASRESAASAQRVEGGETGTRVTARPAASSVVRQGLAIPDKAGPIPVSAVRMPGEARIVDAATAIMKADLPRNARMPEPLHLASLSTVGQADLRQPAVVASPDAEAAEAAAAIPPARDARAAVPRAMAGKVAGPLAERVSLRVTPLREADALAVVAPATLALAPVPGLDLGESALGTLRPALPARLPPATTLRDRPVGIELPAPPGLEALPASLGALQGTGAEGANTLTDSAPAPTEPSAARTDSPVETAQAQTDGGAPSGGIGIGTRVQPLTDRAAGGGIRINRPIQPAAPAAPGTEPAAQPGTGAMPAPPAPSLGRAGRSPEAAAAPGAVAPDSARPALERNALPFSLPQDGRPLLSVVLVDIGEDDALPEALAELGFPVTVAVPAAAPDAAQRSAQFAALGAEILLGGAGLPDGATPSDAEVALGAYLAAIPGAVALMAGEEESFAEDRALTDQVLQILAEDGHGLLLWDRGLNRALTAAERAGRPVATIYRRIDSRDAGPAEIGRRLDRAVFEARRTGAVIVVGDTRPATLDALQSWGATSRAREVALAPVSAVLLAR